MSAASNQSGQQSPTELRLALLANGYEPIPIVSPDEPGDSPGKRPNLTGWDELNITAEVIRSWSYNWQQARNPNTGLRTGRLVGINNDIRVPELAEEIHDLAIAMLGKTDLERVGLAPKHLLCYQSLNPHLS